MSGFTFKCIRKHVLSKKHKENAKDDAVSQIFDQNARKTSTKTAKNGRMIVKEKKKKNLKVNQRKRDEKESCQPKKDVGRNNENTETRETKKEKEGFLSYLLICCTFSIPKYQYCLGN